MTQPLGTASYRHHLAHRSRAAVQQVHGGAGREGSLTTKGPAGCACRLRSTEHRSTECLGPGQVRSSTFAPPVKWNLRARAMPMGLARMAKGRATVMEEPGTAMVHHVARCERRAARGRRGLAVERDADGVGTFNEGPSRRHGGTGRRRGESCRSMRTASSPWLSRTCCQASQPPGIKSRPSSHTHLGWVIDTAGCSEDTTGA